jgi:hypothetical protein
MVNWLVFLKVISIFLLRRPVLHMRLKFLISFLSIRNKGPECLANIAYMQQRLQTFRFSKRQVVETPLEVFRFWDVIRNILSSNISYVFQCPDDKDKID